jgi:uncharacterized protein
MHEDRGMTERTSYDPGTPSWVDLSTPDVDAAGRFYGEVFGWQTEAAGPPEETGGYAMFKLNGKNVAGVGPVQDENQPPVWSTFVSTDDADGVTAKAREAGANVLVEPMDVMDAGRMAVLMHPATGVIGLWQPGRHTGAELVNEPGAMTWNELHTRDVDGAKAFLGSVFGWVPDDQDFGGMTYTVLRLGENGIGGMMRMGDEMPADVPAFWLTVFEAADVDATVARVPELGGNVAMPPSDIPNIGRFAVVTDPHGATFGVITSVPQQA